jgi:8-oxo-dGTP diphosphatase
LAELHSLIRPTLGVSVAVWKSDHVLLIQRGKEPFIGSWSFPGGKVTAGESLETAARRELAEETGLKVKTLSFVRPVEIILYQNKDVLSHHIALMLFAARWDGGEARASGDAAALRWTSLDEIPSLSVTQGLEKYARACWELLNKVKA